MGNPDHILVVDDDLGLRELLDRYFVGNGYRVTTVANGRQMREVLANHRIDLILLDLMLPIMNGFEVLHELRKHFTTPVLILTALVWLASGFVRRFMQGNREDDRKGIDGKGLDEIEFH